MTRFLALIFAVCSAAVLTACSSVADPEPACAAAYWVSTGGDDAAGGGRFSPFRTLERARQAVRADTRRGQCTIEVNVRAGTSALAQTLALDSGDSGSPQAPVIWRAAEGDTGPVVLSGGLEVRGFTCAGADCVASVRGLPAGARPRQLYVDGQRAVRFGDRQPGLGRRHPIAGGLAPRSRAADGGGAPPGRRGRPPWRAVPRSPALELPAAPARRSEGCL